MRSEVQLHLPEAPGDGWDVDVRWGDDIHDSAELPDGTMIATYEIEGERWYTATAVASHYRLRFRDCGEFVISGDLTDVRVRRDPTGRNDLLPILLAGTVSAFLLALRGQTVLHASAVAREDAALAFVGQSGRGKSTLAALLCLHGAALVTDDVLVVDPGPPVTCVGGASELRLRAAAAPLAHQHPEQASRTTADDRVAFAPTAAPHAPLPLSAIVIPTPSRTASEVQTELIPPSDALFAVLSFPRIHGWCEHGVLTRDFTNLSRIVNNVPVFHAIVPWGPPFRPDVAAALLALLNPSPA
jgi:hypothetical protein